jgi:predicted transcriptional regulator
VPRGPAPGAQAKQPIPPFNGDLLAGIDKSGKAVLSVLAQHGSLDNDRIALIAGYSPRASTVSVALSKLRRNGLVTDGQPVSITEAGLSVAVVTPLPTGDELLRYWGGDPDTQQGGHSSLDKSAKRVFWALVNAHPTSLSQHELADLTGYSPEASTISVALSRLRKLKLVAGFAMSNDFMQTVWGTR